MAIPTTPTLKTVAALDYTSDLVQYVDPNNQLLAKIDHTGAFISSGGGEVNSVFGRSGTVVATTGDYTAAQVTGAAPLASPTFTGVPAAPTATALTSTTQLATTAFTTLAVGVETTRATAAEALKSPIASPTFTGVVTLPSLVESGTLSPTSAGTAGVTGQIAWDGSNIYVCTAGGIAGAATWKAAAITAV